MRLRTTLFGVLALIAIVLAGTVYAGFALHKGDMVDQERLDLEVTADAISETLDARIDEKRRTVSLAASHPAAASHGSEEQAAHVRRFVEETEFDGASLVDGDGTMVQISAANLTDPRREELIGSDFSHRTYVRHSLAGETHVTDPFRAASGNLIVTISAPVETADGEVVGSFNAALHLKRSTMFERLAEMRAPGEEIRITGGNHTLYETESDPPSYLVATTNLSESGWTLSVSKGSETIENRLWVATATQSAAVGIAILSVALIGLWVSRTTLRHIDELIDGLGRLESGEYDREIDLGVTAEWTKISTQFNALAETLSQRDSQLSVLNRVLRHNLRNDMSVIIAHADTIIHQENEPDEEAVRTIRETAYNLIETSDHARAIYEQLLSGDEKQRVPVDVPAVVADEVAHLREEFPRATIETDLPEDAWALDGDTIPILVDELTRNALIHNDLPQGERSVSLDVRRDRSGGDVLLSVSDNGPGLPEVETRLLTGEREETSIDHGSGLGLWVVNWMVDQLGGEISIESSDGQGTTVTVRLPGTDPPEQTRDDVDVPEN